MKNIFLIVAIVFASVLVVNSSPLMAQAADAGAKTDQELAGENAALRKQIDRLQVELRNSELRQQVHGLKAKKDKLAVAPTNTQNAVEATRNQKSHGWIGSAAAISPAVTNAYAADLPVKAPQAAPLEPHGFYTWLDGSYQRINLPNYKLGFKFTDANSGLASGIIDTFNAHASGGGIAGGVGYLLPYAPTSPWFGSNMRVEVAGSYVKANATQTGGTSFTGSGAAPPGIGLNLLNGTSPFSTGCGSPSICQTTDSLQTDYSSWQINGRIASDYRYGLVTLTPSLGLFGGNTHNDQTLAENLAFGNGATVKITYNATTSLRWTDLGGRLGLDSKLAVHPWVTLGLGGWFGWADRWTDFTGTDSFNIINNGVGLLAPPTSSLVSSTTRTAFLANLEASVAVTPAPNWTGRAFIGLNYDDSVPGISTPTSGGPLFAPPTSVTPAGIVYAKETSWYAGGGLIYRFY